MEKTPENNRPVLAILAAESSGGIRAYLTQMATLAGWRVGEEGSAAAQLTQAGTRLVLRQGQEETSWDLPARAGDIIARLSRYARGEIDAPATMKIGNYQLFPQEYLLLDKEGQGIRLTEKETALLLCLARAGGRSLSRQALLDAIWAYAPGVETHTLETHIYRLRQKIETDPANPSFLITLDEGYALAL